MSLRLRLVLATLTLTALGLGAAAFATYGLVRDDLYGRVDDDLAADAPEVAGHLRRPRIAFPERDDDRPEPYVPVEPGTFAQLMAADGTVLSMISYTSDEEPDSPDLSDMPALDGRAHWFNTGSVDGNTNFRVYVAPADAGPGTVAPQFILVARPLTDVEQTLNDLLVVQAVASLAVLAVVGGLVYLAVWYGLRPLNRVVETADAIAGGELERRAPASSPKTEVGRLATAFNAMVAAIQESLRRREASEQRLRRFVADASHELRTPLTSLKGYAEILRRPDIAQDDRSQGARRIEEASDRMSRLVDDMLFLARMDEEPPMQLERFDLRDVLTAAVADARAADPGRELALSLNGPVMVVGDKDHVGRAVANLLGNVRVHTPEGTAAEVRLSLEGPVAAIAVRDYGPGIAADHQEQLFDRFYRVDKSRSRASGGAGLGLSVVDSIAAAHGGSVRMETKPGDGATFTILLPLAGPNTPR